MLAFFFFNDTATTEIYTLSLHDALPIYQVRHLRLQRFGSDVHMHGQPVAKTGDRKSTRLNSSHLVISYAVFCLKKKRRDVHSPAPVLRETDVSARSAISGHFHRIIPAFT